MFRFSPLASVGRDRLSAFFLFTGFVAAFIWPPMNGLVMGMISVLCVLLALILHEPRRLGAMMFDPRHPVAQRVLAIMLILFATWLAIRAVTADVPARAMAQSGLYILPVLAALATALIADPQTRMNLWRGILVLLTGLAMFTILSAVLPMAEALLTSIGRTQYPFENANHLAMMMNAGLFLTLWPGLVSRQRMQWFLALLLITALLTTGSRGGVITGAAGLVLWWWLARPARGQKTILIAGGMGIVASAIAAFSGAGLMALSSLTVLVTNPQVGLGSRPDLIASALDLIATRPVFGFGTGTFAFVFPQVMTHAHLTSAYALHNDFLQIILETGIIGGVLYAAIFGLALYLVIRTKHPARAAMAGLLVTIMLHAQIEFIWGVLPPLILIGMVLGTALKSNESTDVSAPLKWAGHGTVFGLLLITTVSLMQIYAEYTLARAEERLHRQDMAGFAVLLEHGRAYSLDQHAVPYARAAEYRLALFLNGHPDADLASIQDQITAGLARNPYLPALYDIQGRLDQARGESPLPAWKEGLRREPRSADLRLVLLRYYQSRGDTGHIQRLIDEAKRWPALKGRVQEWQAATDSF